MTHQDTLFDAPPPREYVTVTDPRLSDPETSREAAQSHREARIKGRERVRAALALYGPLTDYELSCRTGLPRHVAAKRRGDVGAVWTGEWRPTDTGCRARVWRLS